MSPITPFQEEWYIGLAIVLITRLDFAENNLLDSDIAKLLDFPYVTHILSIHYATATEPERYSHAIHSIIL